jgi:hypothetical protein
MSQMVYKGLFLDWAGTVTREDSCASPATPPIISEAADEFGPLGRST